MTKPLQENQDAFGHALLDYLEGKGGEEIVERSDGHLALSAGAERYFGEPEGHDLDALRHATGRVLDIGCGPGRVALYCQKQGHAVVAVDVSPLAIEVCRRRGVANARLLSIDRIDRSLGEFDTIVMMGNNFGLFGNPGKAHRLLRRFARLTSAQARIIAQTLDPYATTDESHLRYHEQNRRGGRMGGQIRMRIRYKTYKTPWFDYLLVSEAELQEVLNGSDWRVAEVLRTESAAYTMILRKTAE
jgi:SAM-dependent methyltransferase